MAYPSHGIGYFGVIKRRLALDGADRVTSFRLTQEDADRIADEMQRKQPHESFAVVELVIRRYVKKHVY